MASPEARMDPNSPVAKATLDHIMEHLNFLKTADPQLLALLHEQSLMPQGQPPQQGGPGGPMDATPPVQQAAEEVNLPSLPNPPQGADEQSAALINDQAMMAQDAMNG